MAIVVQFIQNTAERFKNVLALPKKNSDKISYAQAYDKKSYLHVFALKTLFIFEG